MADIINFRKAVIRMDAKRFARSEFPEWDTDETADQILESMALKEAQTIRDALDYAQDAYGARMENLGIRRIFE